MRLIPEHLRLGTWDLLCGWSGQSGGRVEPRLALPLIQEAALCSTGLRHQRVLSQRGVELANGLPFVAGDVAVHELLAEPTVAEAQRLQVALGRIRRASGDYVGKRLAIDPHRLRSYRKRQRRRYRDDETTVPDGRAASRRSLPVRPTHRGKAGRLPPGRLPFHE